MHWQTEAVLKPVRAQQQGMNQFSARKEEMKSCQVRK